jgi:hypothetical protein
MKKLTTKTFIQKAQSKHKNKYTYENTNYVNSDSKVTITCQDHGDFEQSAGNHIYNGAGCPECAKKAKSKKLTKTTSEFIEEANSIHNNVYDYSLAVYTRNDVKTVIICPIHGEFKQTPSMHVSGQGCPKCAHKRIGAARRLTKEQFITKAMNVHGDTYIYDKVTYKNSRTKVDIFCTGCNTYFKQNPDDHMQGHGCPNCCKYGIEITKPIVFYILELEADVTAYKIGLTNKSVKIRYQSDNPNKAIKQVLLEVSFLDSYEAILFEKEVKEKFHSSLFKGDIKFFGKTKNTEVLTCNPYDYVTSKLKPKAEAA